MPKKLFLIIILIFALFFRFYKLNTYPALNADEAAIGYNAYSLIQTGMDEHGNSWPLHFQSFNDYKPGLYFYLVLPFVKMFGLNEWSVRLPNAFLGVVTVYLVYLLVMELTGYGLQVSGEETRNTLTRKFLTGITAAFFLAISPWHLHFSRGGWEVNVATFFITLGVYLFLKAHNSDFKKDNPDNKTSDSVSNISHLTSHIIFPSTIYYLLSTLSFVLSMYTYHAARIITPLIVFGILGIYFDDLRRNLKKYFMVAILGFILLVPLARELLKPEFSSRAAGVGLFADPGPLSRANEQRSEHADYNSKITRIFHNKAVNYIFAFGENWAAHFHGLFLFLSGDDIQRDRVPETGQMYLTDLLWLVVGLLWLIKNIGIGHPEFISGSSVHNKEKLNRVQNDNKSVRLIIHWLLVAPVAAALTFQSPHALRAENMVIPLSIVSAIGLFVVIQQLNNITIKQFKIFGYLFICLLVLIQFARYFHMYYIHMSKEYPFSSQYGAKELVNYVRTKEGNFKNIVVTTKYDQPYVMFLFYLKYPPSDFQKDHRLTTKDQYGFSTVPAFGKYIFKNISWDSDRIDYPSSLIIGTKDEIPGEANIVQRIYGSNGYEYFDVVAN